MRIKSAWKSRCFAIAALASIAFAPAPAGAVESSDPIKIALFDWTSVNINARILGDILEKLGYTVEYPTGDYLSSLTTGLTNGDMTVGMEYWDTTAGDAMKASDATGQTVDRVARDVDRDYIMEAQQALDYGMIDRIIASRDMPVPSR